MIPQISLSLSSFWSVIFTKLAHESVQQCLLISWSVDLCAVTLCQFITLVPACPLENVSSSSSPCNGSRPASLVLSSSASSRYPVRGCSLHFSVPAHKISYTCLVEIVKTVHHIYLSKEIINWTTSKAKSFPKEWTFLLAVAQVPAFEVSYPS